MTEALTWNFQQVVQIHCAEGHTTNFGVLAAHYAVQCSADGSTEAAERGEIPECVSQKCGKPPAIIFACEHPD